MSRKMDWAKAGLRNRLQRQGAVNVDAPAIPGKKKRKPKSRPVVLKVQSAEEKARAKAEYEAFWKEKRAAEARKRTEKSK